MSRLQFSTNSSAFQYLFGKEKNRTLLLGLEGSGKTTILTQLKIGQIITSIPTIGFNVETIKSKARTIISWDLRGQDKQRTSWRPYFQNIESLIFVVDSADHERLTKAHDELQKLLSETDLNNACLLVYANKRDLSNPMSISEIKDKLGLRSLTNRQWHVEDTCATNGDGLFEGLDWLAKHSDNVK